MGDILLFSLNYRGDTYKVFDRMIGGTSVEDCDGHGFAVPSGIEPTETLVRYLLGMRDSWHEQGQLSGRCQLQFELRRLLGAAEGN